VALLISRVGKAAVSALLTGAGGGCVARDAARLAAANTPPPSRASTAPPHPGRFSDRTRAAGIDFRWAVAGERPLNILQTIGCGAAFLDYDGDGNLDALLVGPTPALYRGDGKGRFTDVSAATRVSSLSGHFLGCAVGDYDNDGDPDVYLSAYRGGALLRNEAGKRFADVTRASGIPAQPWGSACAWGDADNDGRLDLYVGNYVRFSGRGENCFLGPDLRLPCGPQFYTKETGRLFVNRGGGRFADATERWRAQWVSGKTLGAAWVPLDGRPSRPALSLANDTVPNNLLVNAGGARFEPAGAAAGVALGRDGSALAGMGMDWGDYDNDGRLDLALMTFAAQEKPIYRNEGTTLFEDRSTALGVTPTLWNQVSFGVKWLDFDNDGWLDLLVASGHISDQVHRYAPPEQGYRQPTRLLRNERGRRFAPRPVRFPAEPLVGRGVATGDYDNDGRVDALVTTVEGAPQLLHNETERAGRFLLLRLEGNGVRRSPRDGTGALVEVTTAGGRRLVRHCHTDGSYFSASDGRVHVGLGDAASASVRVRWPGGRTQTFPHLACDRLHVLKEKTP
jgi:hypothetical protein